MKTILTLTPEQLESISFDEQRIHFVSDLGKVVVILNQKSEHAKSIEDLKETPCAFIVGEVPEDNEQLQEAVDKAKKELETVSESYSNLLKTYNTQADELNAAKQQIAELTNNAQLASQALGVMEEQLKKANATPAPTETKAQG